MVHVIGLQFLGFFVSVVFDKIYVASSDSNFGAFSGISTTSDSNDASIECRFERASRQKLQIFSIPGDFYLWGFFSAASIFSLLIFFSNLVFVYCSSFFVCAFSTLILRRILFLHFISVSTTSPYLQWWVLHLQLSFPSLLIYKTSFLLFLKICFGGKIFSFCHAPLVF